MTEKKIVEEPFSKVFQKIGITGIASSLFTLLIGIFVILYHLEWEQLKLLVGLYLLMVGSINLTGHVVSMVTRRKGEKTYIETETFYPKLKDHEPVPEQKADE